MVIALILLQSHKVLKNKIDYRIPMEEMIGKEGEKRLSTIGMEQMLVSMGHQACGAVSLWNYPSWMRNLVAHDIDGDDRPDPIDMAALESKPVRSKPTLLPLHI